MLSQIDLTHPASTEQTPIIAVSARSRIPAFFRTLLGSTWGVGLGSPMSRTPNEPVLGVHPYDDHRGLLRHCECRRDSGLKAFVGTIGGAPAATGSGAHVVRCRPEDDDARNPKGRCEVHFRIGNFVACFRWWVTLGPKARRRRSAPCNATSSTLPDWWR